MTCVVEERSWRKISPFRASHSRHSTVYRIEGQRSPSSPFGGSRRHGSSSDMEAAAVIPSDCHIEEMAGHPKKMCCLSLESFEQRSHTSSLSICLWKRFALELNLSLKYSNEKSLTLLGTAEPQMYFVQVLMF